MQRRGPGTGRLVELAEQDVICLHMAHVQERAGGKNSAMSAHNASLTNGFLMPLRYHTG